METITPLLLDERRGRLKWRCPECRKVHWWEFGEHWTRLRSIVPANCHGERQHPVSLPQYQLLIWEPDGNGQPVLSVPNGDIPRMPNPDCCECKGTGEWEGFNLVSPCKSCKMEA